MPYLRLHVLFVELGCTLLEVLLAGWLAEVLCDDRSLQTSLVMSDTMTWAQTRTGAALWSWIVALAEPPLVAPVSSWCRSWEEAVESEDSLATWSKMSMV